MRNFAEQDTRFEPRVVKRIPSFRLGSDLCYSVRNTLLGQLLSSSVVRSLPEIRSGSALKRVRWLRLFARQSIDDRVLDWLLEMRASRVWGLELASKDVGAV